MSMRQPDLFGHRTWTLTDSDDTVETYTVASGVGTLNTIKLRNGYTQTMHYTTGKLTSVTDTYGRTLGLTYTGSVVTGVTTPDSLSLTYGYTTVNSQSLLTSVSYSTSPTTHADLRLRQHQSSLRPHRHHRRERPRLRQLGL